MESCRHGGEKRKGEAEADKGKRQRGVDIK